MIAATNRTTVSWRIFQMYSCICIEYKRFKNFLSKYQPTLIFYMQLMLKIKLYFVKTLCTVWITWKTDLGRKTWEQHATFYI